MKDPYLDPAQVFAILVRYFYDHRREIDRVDMSDWHGTEEVAVDTERIACAIRRTGRVTTRQFKDAMNLPRTAFTLLRAIDKAFSRVSPGGAAYARGRLGEFRQRLWETGSYYRDEHGFVLPRRSFPNRPQPVPDDLPDYLESLMHVAHPADDGLHFNVLRDEELEFRETIRKGSIKSARIKVGCVPFIADLTELDMNPIVRTGKKYYSITLQRGLNGRDWRSHWEDRARAALANLDDSGVHIGILPELALTDDLLTWWQRTLARTTRPARSRLQWILVGTGPLTVPGGTDRRPNRGALLHRDNGRVVLHQDKVKGFSISDDQLERWQLTCLRPGPRAEWMREGHDRYVLDAWAGRFAMMICEDFGRLFELGAPLATLGPTHVLVPIFAPPIERYRWQEKAAEHYTSFGGAISIVANSNAIGPPVDVEQSDDLGCALLVQPGVRRLKETYSVQTLVRSVEADPSDVATFTVPRS
jgi:hypothetical protein